MKIFLNCRISILIILGFSFVKNINGQLNHLLVYEENISPLASSESILTIHQSFINFENQFLPNKINASNKLINFGYRLLKFSTINLFIDNSAKLIQHEAFGHGYRQREFGFTNNTLNLKITLFGFSGFSRLGTPSPGRIFPNQEQSMWVMGGPEATSILSETILTHWIRNEKISLPDTYLYVSGLQLGRLSAANYDDNINSDAELYLKRINNHYGFSGIENYKLTLNKVRTHALIELLNPYLFYTLYSFSKDYLWSGNDKTNLPMIKLGNMKYMPYFKYWLTPYGSEFQLNNILKTGKKIIRHHIRLGDSTFDSASWGTGISIENLFQNNWFQFAFDLNLWHQPELELGQIGTTFIKEKGFGGAVRIYTYFKFLTRPDQNISTDLFLNIGYKTRGYLQGEELSDDIILRFGLAFSY